MTGMKAKRVTIQDIARKSGYSKTSVSFAFNSPERISKEAVEKILRTAKELDYIPDPMARNFSLGRHMSIGFLLPQIFQESLQNPYMISVVRAIGSICESRGYTLTLVPPLHSSVTEAIKNATVDGIITMGLRIDKSIREVLRQRNLPLVSIDGLENDEIPAVSIDDRAAAKLQLEKVLEKGHRRIAIITLPGSAFPGSSSDSIAERRLCGYKEALSEYGLSPDSVTFIESGATYIDGMKCAEMILADSLPSCIVTMSDVVALGVIDEISKKDLRPGQDISVIGFDGLEKDGIPCHGLSTIYQSAEEKGRKSAELIFSMIEDPKCSPSPVRIGFEYIEGNTLSQRKD